MFSFNRARALAGDLASDLTHTFGRWVLFIEAGLGVMLLGFIFVVGNLVYPYSPIEVYEYRTVPAEVCPGGDVAVEIEWEIGDDLRALKVVYRWNERDDPGTVFGGEARFEDVAARPIMKRDSLLIRPAPLDPGLWILQTSFDIFGTRFGMPVRQDLDKVTSEDFVRVLEPSDKRCEGRQ